MKYEGKLYIDDRDALLEYGVFVEQYGFKQLIQMPSFKKVDSTDWPEEDGEEFDLTSPVLDAKILQIQFCITNVRYAEDLFEDLSTGAYHTFRFVDLKKTYKLRMTTNGSFSQLIKAGKITLTFSDDFPEIPEGEHFPLNKSGVYQMGYELDGIDISQFGSYVLKDTDPNIRKAATTKTNLSVDIKNLAGVIYDDYYVKFKTKDITLKLLIDAENIDQFWQRWNSLFAVLLQPEERLFYFAALGNEFDCYYKSNTVSKFDVLRSGKVWCEFSIVITLTSYHPVGSWMLLATEDFNWIVTEGSDPARIRVRPKSGISLLVAEEGAYIITESDSNKIYINN